MSKAHYFHLHARRCVDRAISQAYRDLHGPRTKAGFDVLLSAVWERSDYLRPAKVFRNRFAEVHALRNLACFTERWSHCISAWTGACGRLHPTTASLAQHLFSRYPLPLFLSSVWLGRDLDDIGGWRERYIEHAAGRRFRDLEGPMPMSRQIEHHFLRSPAHLNVKEALRRAELLSLGAGEELLLAVMATRLAKDLGQGPFWRTVMRFLVRFEDELELSQVGPIIDFIHFARHEQLEVQTDAGVMRMPPPEPNFSMKGRTVASLLRRMAGWHKELQRVPGPSFSWAPLGLDVVRYEERAATAEDERVVWEFVELSNSELLRREGQALSHCVASYSQSCVRGTSRIFSLRRQVGVNEARPVVTIEVNPRTRMVVQARGKCNRYPCPGASKWMRKWGALQGFQLKVF